MTSPGSVLSRYRNNVEPLRSERRLELLVLLVLLLVAAQLIWLGVQQFGGALPGAIAPAPDSLRVAEPADTGSIDRAQSLTLRSRPLFWVSRRPLDDVVGETADAVVVGGTPAARLEDLELTGAIGAGERGVAIVTYKGRRMRIAVGEEIDGWALLRVSPDEAVFVSAGTRDVRRLTQRPVSAQRDEQSAAAPDGMAAAAATADPVPAAATGTPRAGAAGTGGGPEPTLSFGGFSRANPAKKE